MSAVHHSTSQGASMRYSSRFEASKASSLVSEEWEPSEWKVPKRAKFSNGMSFKGKVVPSVAWEPLRSKSVPSSASEPLSGRIDSSAFWKAFRSNGVPSSEKSSDKSSSKNESIGCKSVSPCAAWVPLRSKSVPSSASEPLPGKVDSSAFWKAFRSNVNPISREALRAKAPKGKSLRGVVDPVVLKSPEDNIFNIPAAHHSASDGIPKKHSCGYEASKANSSKFLREISEKSKPFERGLPTRVMHQQGKASKGKPEVEVNSSSGQSRKDNTPKGESSRRAVIFSDGETRKDRPPKVCISVDWKPSEEPAVTGNVKARFKTEDEVNADFRPPGKHGEGGAERMNKPDTALPKSPSTRNHLWNRPVCKSSNATVSCIPSVISRPNLSVSKAASFFESLQDSKKANQEKVKPESKLCNVRLSSSSDTGRHFSLSYASCKLKSKLVSVGKLKDTEVSLYDIKSDENYSRVESLSPQTSQEYCLEADAPIDTSSVIDTVQLTISETEIMSAMQDAETETAQVTMVQKEEDTSMVPPGHLTGRSSGFSLNSGDVEAIPTPFARSIRRPFNDTAHWYDQKTASTLASPTLATISPRMTEDSGKLASIFDEHPSLSYSRASSSIPIITSGGRTYQLKDSAPRQFTTYAAMRLEHSKRNGGVAPLPSKLATFEDSAVRNSFAARANSSGPFHERHAKYQAPQSLFTRSEALGTCSKTERPAANFLGIYDKTALFICRNDTETFVSTNQHATVPSHDTDIYRYHSDRHCADTFSMSRFNTYRGNSDMYSSDRYTRTKYDYKSSLGARIKSKVRGWKRSLSQGWFNFQLDTETNKEQIRWTLNCLESRNAVKYSIFCTRMKMKRTRYRNSIRSFFDFSTSVTYDSRLGVYV